VVSPIDLNTQGGDDWLQILDAWDGAPNTFHMDASEIGGGAFGGPVTPGGIFGAGGILTYDGNLEWLYVYAPDGLGVDNTYNVDATGVGLASGYGSVDLEDGEGSAVFNVQGDQLSNPADHSFSGYGGTETFNVRLAGDATLTGNAVTILGGDPTGDTGSRDVVNLIDAGGARNTTVTYQSPTGQALVDVDGGTTLDIRFVETVEALGDGGNDDTVTVVGSAGDDELSVVPTGANSALVFQDGDPWDGPSEGDFFDQFPGAVGGGLGPDLNLGDVVPGGILIDAGAGNANTVYVHAPGETNLVHTPTETAGVDPFGYGDGVIIPSAAALGLPDGYDAIDVSDSAVVINNTGGGLLPVNLVTASLVQADPGDVGLVVNAGFEGNHPVADDVTLTPSANFVMQINGGDPDPGTTGIVLPQGDQLTVAVPPGAEVDVYTDKLTPRHVSIDIDGVLPFNYSSIEGLWLTGATTVNLIGDNNDTAPQTDNFVVEGRGFQEAAINVNGSGPIFFDGLQLLNVIGHDEVDTLEITPYADDTPLGWGVDVFYDEGEPTQDDGGQSDLIILHTSLLGGAVSEDIVIQPAGPESGEIVVTNAGFGTPIVDVDYVANLDIIVLDDDGFANDSDTLTLRGTNPDNPLTSGSETLDIDFGAAGAVASPMVTVSDTSTSTLLYRLRTIDDPIVSGDPTFSTVYFDSLGGTDVFDVTPDAHVAVTIDAGNPIGAIQSSGDTLNVTTGSATYTVALNEDLDSGTVAVSGAQPVTFVDIELLQLDGTDYVVPTQRPTIDLPDASDTGISNLDNVTNAPNPVSFTVTAEVGTTVVIKDGNTVIDGPYVSTGTDVRTLTLGDGTHKLSAEASDADSNELFQSEELIVTVDRTLPATPAAPNLLTSSDTFDDVAGLVGPQWTNTDEVTAINQPGLTARPNRTRSFACWPTGSSWEKGS